MKLSIILLLVLGTSTALAQPVFTETGQDLRGPFIEPFADSTHSDVAAADIDGDGDLDLLFADDSGGGIERGSVAFLNDGQGFFSASSQSIGDGIAEALSAADLNGDGLPDLVLANTSNNLNTDEVYLNNGTGFFELSQTLSASRARDVVTGDFDGNGSIDILIAAATGTVGGAQNLLYTNNGDGTFAEPTMLSATNPSFGAAVGDLDGDGDLDIFIANTGPNRVLLNVAGTLTDSGAGYGDSQTAAVALGDVDGDGDLDAITANAGLLSGTINGESNRVWLNNGTGGFTDSGVALDLLRSEAVALADIDGNGFLDIWFANLDEPDSLWLNSSGSFSRAEVALGASNFSQSVVAADFDGDTDADFAVTDFNGNRVWLNGDLSGEPGVSIAPVRAVSDEGGAPQLFGLGGFPLGIPLLVEGVDATSVTVGYQLTSATGTLSSQLVVSRPGPSTTINSVPLPEDTPPYSAQLLLTEDTTAPINAPALASYLILDLAAITSNAPAGKGLGIGQACLATALCLAFGQAGFDPCGQVFKTGKGGFIPPSLNLPQLRRLRDEVMIPTPSGRYYSNLFYDNSSELIEVVFSHPTLAYDVVEAGRLWSPAIDSELNGDGSFLITPEMGTIYGEVTDQLRAFSSPRLRQLIEREDALIQPMSFVGKTAGEYWEAVTTARTEGLFRSGFEDQPF
ncbi:MAG: VCBS repeat-containing protein [Pseudomonadota bacterium]